MMDIEIVKGLARISLRLFEEGIKDEMMTDEENELYTVLVQLDKEVNG